MKRLLLQVVGLFMAAGAFAYNAGDYVYTNDARYKVTDVTNLVKNGSFTVADRASADFGWKDATGANLSAEGWSIEPEKGPDGQTVLESLSGAEGITAYQAFPYEAGKSYVISFKVMGPANATTTIVEGQSNYIDVYTNADGTCAKTDEALQQIAKAAPIASNWSEVTYAFTDANNADGMMVISLGRLATGTQITDIQVVAAKRVYDIRPMERSIQVGRLLVNSGEFTMDADSKALFEEQLEIAEGVLASGDAETIDDEAIMAGLEEGLAETRQAFLDANSGDLISRVSSGDIAGWPKFNNGDGKREQGDWVFTGCNRMGHATGAVEANLSYPSSYDLTWGQASIDRKVAPGRYMFAIDAYALKYTTGPNKDLYYPDYSMKAEGAKVFVNADTVECGALDNIVANTYIAFGNVGEDGMLSAGIYFPGFPEGTGGGTFRYKNAVLRQVGVNQAAVDRAFYVQDIALQQSELLKRIEQANADLADAQYVWGKAGYTDSLAKAQELYTASLSYVDANGKDLGMDIPEAYDDLLLNDGVRYMNTSRNWFTALNKPYVDLVAKVADGKAKLADETLAGASATSKAALEKAVADAEALIAGATATDTPDVEPFIAAFANIDNCIFNFEMSCASFETPASLMIQNPDFRINDGQKSGKCEGWDLNLQSDSKGWWFFHEDSKFTSNYSIYVSRGNIAFSKNKATQKITVTEPGVYAYYCEAYAVNTNESTYNKMWNGLSGEDSLRISGIRLFFGAEGTPDSVNVCTNMVNFIDWNYDEVRSYKMLYVKKTAGEEVLEFGMDALENGDPMGAGCNLYGFGSNKLFYYGSEDTYLNGITNAEADKKAYEEAPVYTLSGVMMGKSTANLPKGVYIKGGKKFVVNK